MNNIIENNKLIAKFMGFTVNFGFNKNGVLFHGEHINLGKLKHHDEWDWLMEVVEKIESLGNDILITSNYIQITYDKGEKFITIELEGNIKIFAVYNACIEFIKWYNEQNKNNEKHTCIIDK